MTAGGPSARPVVVDWRESWAARAASLAAEVRRLLGDEAARVEHIGSTAIPGMAAKDVIDLQAGVRDLTRAAALLDGPLQRMGFRRSPYERDHVPVGSDPAAGWSKRLWVRRGTGDDVNLHVRLAGSGNERLALLFRDWFRAHPEAVPTYGAFKRALAEAVPDLDTYTDVKDPVVDLVRVTAEPWAAATGWTV